MSGIIGIGNAITDIVTLLPDDDLLTKIGFPKGSMQLVDIDTITQIDQLTQHCPKTLKSGGSVGNTMYGIAVLGAPSTYIGKIGNDDIGKLYEQDMKQHGVQCYMLQSSLHSGKAIAMITPDSERTFATYLGAASTINTEDINELWFDNQNIFHIEGYLVFNTDLMIYIATIAKKKGLLISYDLASYNIVENNLDFIRFFLKKYVDIVFANEEEAAAFTGTTNINESINIFSQFCNYAIIKLGKKGSIIKHNGATISIPAINVKSIDTTGAGDWYASGFLYGLYHQLPIEKCGQIASYLAGKVVEHIGAKIPEEKLISVKNNIPL